MNLDSRPRLGLALDALLQHVVVSVSPFGQVDPASVLLVAGAALKHSRATIRGFHGEAAPTVRYAGHAVLYEVTLRPLFFREANGLGRLMTLFHELFHISTQANGTLEPSRRHGGPQGDFDDQVERLARVYAAKAPASLLAPLAHEGEVLMRQWRVRPGSQDQARVYDERHLFEGPLMMHTPAGERSGWW